MESDRATVLVLGGGLTGLTASRHLGAPLFEANDSPGGVARTRRTQGFCFDYGIHVLQTEHPEIEQLFRELDIQLCTRDRVANIYSHGTFTPYPFQINTAGLPFPLRAKCVLGYLRKERGTKPKDYREWIYKNVGKGFGDTFLIPYSKKFWTIPPEEMTCEWTGNRIPETNIWRILRGALVSKQTKVGSNAVFRYPDHGTGFTEIAQRMSESNENLYLGCRATRIDTDQRVIEFNDGEFIREFDKIISTIPLPELVSITTKPPTDVAEAAAKLRANSIIVVNLGIASENLSNNHWIHFPEKDVCFFRISFPHNFSAGLTPRGMSSVSAEIAYSDLSPIDKSSIVEQVKSDLIRTGVLNEDQTIVVEDVADIKYGYVIYDKWRKRSVRQIREWLMSVGIETAGRYGLWAYLWSHESILSGLRTAQRVSADSRRFERSRKPSTI